MPSRSRRPFPSSRKRRSTRRRFLMPSSKPSATRRPPSSVSEAAPRTHPICRAAVLQTQQHPSHGLLGRRGPGDPRHAAEQPRHGPPQGQIHPRHRWQNLRGRKPRRRRNGRLRLSRLSRPLRLLSALAGITTVKQIRENAFDIKATGRLNRLYIELLKENPDWDTAARRQDLNHFFARLIFCFFAEDTDIFRGAGLFTATIEQMSARDSSNTHEVLAELFRAMNTKIADRQAAKIRSWADQFPVCQRRPLLR